MRPRSIANLATETPAHRTSARAAIAGEAEEGLLLAEYATRMRLKNRIIVDTLTGADGVDVERWADEVRLSLGRLRIEAEQSARRMASERDLAASTQGRGEHEHDYRQVDAPILERRRLVYLALAGRLVLWEGDAARVGALLESARQDALQEMERAVRDTVGRGGRTPRGEDEAALRQRLRMIQAIDLPALAAAHRASLDSGEFEDRSAEPPKRRRLLRRAVGRLRWLRARGR
jgi:hypothetical protein